MRRIVCGLSIVAALLALSGTGAAQSVPTVTTSGSRERVPLSLSQMVGEAELIAEVTVESVFPPVLLRKPLSPQQTTATVMHRDSLLRVTRVLKGSESATHIVLNGEMGSPLRPNNTSGLTVLTPGRSLIVFLQKAGPEMIERFAVRSEPRYTLRLPTRPVDIDGLGNVQLDPQLPFHAQHTGKAKSVFEAEIESLVRGTAK